MNVTLLLDIEGFQTVLCCYMSNLKECDNRCVQKKKKKKNRSSFNAGLLFHLFHFPSIRPLHLSSVLFYSSSPPVLNLFHFPHLCFYSPLPCKRPKSDLMKMFQMSSNGFTFSLLSRAFFSLAISFPFHSTSDTSSACFCPTTSLTNVWFI